MRSTVGRRLFGLAGSLVAGSVILAASSILAGSPGRADDGGKHSSVSVERVEMKPTRDGFYDAVVSLAVHDPKLGPGGTIGFAVTINHVHDVDEAIDKAHDPIRLLGQDLQQGYFDLRREP